MSLGSMLTQSATLKTYVYTEDSLGNKIRGTVTNLVIPCRLEMTDSQEVTFGGQTEVSNWRAFLPPDANVDAEHQLVIDGATYEVLGKPAPEVSPRGTHHNVVRLRFVQ